MRIKKLIIAALLVFATFSSSVGSLIVSAQTTDDKLVPLTVDRKGVMTDSKRKKVDWRLWVKTFHDPAGKRPVLPGQARHRKSPVWINKELLENNPFAAKDHSALKKLRAYMRAERRHCSYVARNHRRHYYRGYCRKTTARRDTGKTYNKPPAVTKVPSKTTVPLIVEINPKTPTPTATPTPSPTPVLPGNSVAIIVPSPTPSPTPLLVVTGEQIIDPGNIIQVGGYNPLPTSVFGYQIPANLFAILGILVLLGIALSSAWFVGGPDHREPTQAQKNAAPPSTNNNNVRPLSLGQRLRVLWNSIIARIRKAFRDLQFWYRNWWEQAKKRREARRRSSQPGNFNP